MRFYLTKDKNLQNVKNTQHHFRQSEPESLASDTCNIWDYVLSRICRCIRCHFKPSVITLLEETSKEKYCRTCGQSQVLGQKFILKPSYLDQHLGDICRLGQIKLQQVCAVAVVVGSQLVQVDHRGIRRKDLPVCLSAGTNHQGYNNVLGIIWLTFWPINMWSLNIVSSAVRIFLNAYQNKEMVSFILI